MSVPPKYRALGDFPSYYSGASQAPYLTLFVGGNHEASSHLFELYYGGWVAPNIYYLGAANVVWVGPLRITGLSGIWKGHDYRKPHHERLPYSPDDVKSIYHVREWDVRKLLLLRSQVDVGMSHDWPQGVEWCGDWKRLFREKRGFEEDARSGKLGSVAAKQVMQRLRPKYWFSAHLHCKFAAVVEHGEGTGLSQSAEKVEGAVGGEKAGANGEQTEKQFAANEEEIEIDLEDSDDNKQPIASSSKSSANVQDPNGVSGVSEDLRAQLPESFRRNANHIDNTGSTEYLPFPDAIQNKSTNFLALDKCLPGRKFLQLSEISPISESGSTRSERPLSFTYDREWLAINRVFANSLVVGDDKARVPRDQGEAQYRLQIEKEERWVEESVISQHKLAIPQNFQHTAPIYHPQGRQAHQQQALEYTNPQTSQFCSLLQIPNPFDLSPDVREERIRRAPVLHSQQDLYRGGRGGGGGRGWRGDRGGHNRGRGRSRY